VRGSASFAMRRGISQLVIGVTIIGFGTSAPELFVSMIAALQGNPDIAIGNVLGSNIANLGLVLGTSALLVPLMISATIIRFEIPLVIFTAGLAWLFSLNGQLSRLEGLCLLGLLVFFLLVMIFRAGKSKPSAVKTADIADTTLLKSVWFDFGYLIIGLAALAGGSKFFVSGASTIARLFGISEFLIGLSIVALGTSLPEMVASIIAIFRNKADLAVGNLVGSNIFNILLILGLVSSITNIPIPSNALAFDFPVVFIFSLLLLPLAFTQKRISRWEGLLLLLLYSGYIGFIIRRG